MTIHLLRVFTWYKIWKFFTGFLFTLFEANNFIFNAPIIFLDEAFYVIGGLADAFGTNIIGRLDASSKVWSNSGQLVTRRTGHNAIYDGFNLIVIGGDGPGARSTEKCTISNEKFTCSDQDPILNKYAYYPELFLVPEGFCKPWINHEDKSLKGTQFINFSEKILISFCRP